MSTPERHAMWKRRHRELTVSYVADCMAAVFPDRDSDELKKAVSSLPEMELGDLYRRLVQHAFTESIQHSSKTLAANGWFLDMGSTAKSGEVIADMFTDGKEEEAHEIMEVLTARRVDEIEELATRHFPDRRELIKKAFRFHRTEEYDVSVPMLLIQSDGICADIFGREFFRVRNGSVSVRSAVEQKCPDWISDALAHPFRSVPPIMAHSAPRSHEFNRHIILHGLSLDYGSRRNSLRSILLIAYLCGFKSYYEEKKAQPGVTDNPDNAQRV